jgi:predicted anti-sigma-YlaC factor YlaD
MNQCHKVRSAISQEMPLSVDLEQHLFTCSACRRFVRVEQIIGLLSELRQTPTTVVPEDFVERVMNGLNTKRGPKSGFAMTVLRWAAAILIFSMATVYGFSTSEQAAKGVRQVALLTTGYISSDEAETLGF